MSNNRPINTLFLIESLDGKISTGSNDVRDFDADIGKIGLGEGKKQYDDYELTTDLHSLNSGRVLSKVGINKAQAIEKTVVNFIAIDNSHLTKTGVLNLCKKSNIFYLVTTNKNHPAFNIKESNIEILYYENEIDFHDMFEKFKNKYGVDRITVQTGGTLNSILIREGLIDYVSIFIAPALFGGKNVSTLVDGENLQTEEDLKKIKTLELLEVNKLKKSFIHLKYKVLNNKI